MTIGFSPHDGWPVKGQWLAASWHGIRQQCSGSGAQYSPLPHSAQIAQGKSPTEI